MAPRTYTTPLVSSGQVYFSMYTLKSKGRRGVL